MERRLDDIGVADINDDSWLDIYSTNHGFQEILLINNPRGEFTDGLSRLNQYAKKEDKDRHGMAWADYDGDGKTDVFIVHGGMLGRMMKLAPNFQDELLIQDDFGFREDRTAESGIIKKGCSGRQVNWVDFDSDGKLDIYVVCGRGSPPGNLQPNHLYWQKAEGQFVEVAAKRGLDIPRQGSFAWLDADKDGDMDLFWADFFWFGKAVPQHRCQEPLASNPAHWSRGQSPSYWSAGGGSNT